MRSPESLHAFNARAPTLDRQQQQPSPRDGTETSMNNTGQFRVDRRADPAKRRRQVPSATRPEWLELAEAAILYFGVMLLLPLFVVILLYLWGVIG